MITYLIILLFLGLAAIFVSPLYLLPDVSLDPNVATSIATVGGYLWTIWSVLPGTVVSLLAIVALVVAIETHVISYKVIKWIYNKIPGVS